jgi:hypothetical protein
MPDGFWHQSSGTVVPGLESLAFQQVPCRPNRMLTSGCYNLGAKGDGRRRWPGVGRLICRVVCNVVFP